MLSYSLALGFSPGREKRNRRIENRGTRNKNKNKNKNENKNKNKNKN